MIDWNKPIEFREPSRGTSWQPARYATPLLRAGTDVLHAIVVKDGSNDEVLWTVCDDGTTMRGTPVVRNAPSATADSSSRI